MNSILVVDTTYNEDSSSFTNASMTGEQIINFIKENNYEVVPILRINRGNNIYSYHIASEILLGVSSAESVESAISKRNIYVPLEEDSNITNLIITYDTGEIIIHQEELGE